MSNANWRIAFVNIINAAETYCWHRHLSILDKSD